MKQKRTEKAPKSSNTKVRKNVFTRNTSIPQRWLILFSILFCSDYIHLISSFSSHVFFLIYWFSPLRLTNRSIHLYIFSRYFGINGLHYTSISLAFWANFLIKYNFVNIKELYHHTSISVENCIVNPSLLRRLDAGIRKCLCSRW